MKIKFIANACCIIETNNGTQILTDPWIEDGVFDGSWCHFHKLKTTINDLQNIDAIYISHIHPDHYDDRFFNFPKNIPIIILDHGLNFLEKKLSEAGYKNLIKINDGETKEFKDFKLTLFAPFVKHVFFPENTKIGNLIDSAIILQADNQSIFNPNDMPMENNTCREITSQFGHFDFAMMNYNSAGAYPSCFQNLSRDEKVLEHNNNISRNIDVLYTNLKILMPKYFLPFAGTYVLGGKNHYKNKYLGTTTWDKCIEMLKNKEKEQPTKYIALREQDIFDLDTGVSNKEYIPIDDNEVKDYIENVLSKIEYPYENDSRPDTENLIKNLDLSVIKMHERIGRIKLVPDMDVFIKVEDQLINVLSAEKPKGKIECSLDLRLLKRILDRKSHWNNAEIGCHIEFNRSPNYYSPDVHTALQFLHL
jgi:UDP-MurNAc hydroxylase